MTKITELMRSHHIQIALATGASIIALAYFSKRVLPEPIPYLDQAFPPFLAALGEGAVTKYKGSRLGTSWYWVAAILLSTALVIARHWGP